jgi:hypothetical protein
MVMDSTELNTAQAAKMCDAMPPCLGYLYRVKRRMKQRGFPMSDELFRSTNGANDAVQGLCVTLHYLSCKSGVARPTRPTEGHDAGENRREPRSDR